MGDDVGARHALVSRTLNAQQTARLRDTTELAEVHCEVAGDIAAMMGLPAAVESGLRPVWGHYDGSGVPLHLRCGDVPTVGYWAEISRSWRACMASSARWR